MSVKKKYSAQFKAKVALAAISNDKTLAELSTEFGVHPNMISRWKQLLQEGAGEIFSKSKPGTEAAHKKEIDHLHRKIGQLTVERDFLAEAWSKVQA